MVQAQGMRPPDPYQVLQLDPAAPRSLVVEAYLMLSRRAARLGELSWLQELRAAYSGVMGNFGGGPSEAGAENHYQVLRVDTGADEEIIELAYAMLPRLEPVPHRSVARFLRDESYRILMNPSRRAIYDAELKADTLGITPRPQLRPVETSREEPRLDAVPMEKKKRGLFGRGKNADVDAARDERLLGLRTLLPIEPQEHAEDVYADPAEPMVRGSQAEVIFTAGPREGMRVEVNGNVIPLGDGKSTATLWRQGDRVMLRHSGKGVRVGGSTPSLPILVLEDGDELVVGSDRAVFQLLVLPEST